MCCSLPLAFNTNIDVVVHVLVEDVPIACPSRIDDSTGSPHLGLN